MDDTAKKVALVARAIEDVLEANPLVRDDLEYDPGIWEEAARQAIAAYLNAWRTTIESEAEALESRGYRKSAKALRRTTEFVSPARPRSPDAQPLPPECGK